MQTPPKLDRSRNRRPAPEVLRRGCYYGWDVGLRLKLGNALGRAVRLVCDTPDQTAEPGELISLSTERAWAMWECVGYASLAEPPPHHGVAAVNNMHIRETQISGRFEHPQVFAFHSSFRQPSTATPTRISKVLLMRRGLNRRATATIAIATMDGIYAAICRLSSYFLTANKCLSRCALRFDTPRFFCPADP
jgi:hypothetical protein